MTSLVGKKVKVSKSPNLLLNSKTGKVIGVNSPNSPLGFLGIKIYIVEMDSPFFNMKTLPIWYKYLEAVH